MRAPLSSDGSRISQTEKGRGSPTLEGCVPTYHLAKCWPNWGEVGLRVPGAPPYIRHSSRHYFLYFYGNIWPSNKFGPTPLGIWGDVLRYYSCNLLTPKKFRPLISGGSRISQTRGANLCDFLLQTVWKWKKLDREWGKFVAPPWIYQCLNTMYKLIPLQFSTVIVNKCLMEFLLFVFRPKKKRRKLF